MFQSMLRWSALLSLLISTAAAAQQPPEFTKRFSPNPVIENNETRLTFRLDNSANESPAQMVAFTDNLPTGLVVAPTPNIANNCIGGTVTAAAGDTSISYSGGEVPASAACNLSVDVIADTPGQYENITEDLTSSFGNSGPASSTLTVVIDQNLSVTGIFAPSLTAATNLEIVVRNFSGTDAVNAPLEISVTGANSGQVIVDELIPLVPAGDTLIYTTATAFDLSGDTAFAFEATTPSRITQNDTFISDAWLRLPLFDDFESVPTQSYQEDNVLADIPGFSYLLISPGGRFAIRSDFDPDGRRIMSMDNPGGDSSNSIILAFDGTSIPSGEELFLDFNWYDHGDEGDNFDRVQFRGSPLDNWINIYNFATNSNNGSWTNVTDIELTAVLAGAMPAQSLTNQTQIRFNQNDNFPINTDGISIDDVAVGPSLKFSKAFSPGLVAIGESSTLTFTLDNTRGATDATPINLVDNLPAGMTVAAAPAPTTDCIGGTLTATAGSATVSYTAPVLTAGSACTIVLDVDTSQPGDLVNISERLISSVGDSGAATATLTVTQEPGFSKVFAPNPTGIGVPSTLTFTLDNTANTVSADTVDFVDNLPADLIIANNPNATNTCNGGSLTAVATSGTISYSGGQIPAGSSCTITVDVVAELTGDYINLSGDLTSSLGNSGSATDTLTVIVEPPSFGKLFAPNPTAVGVPVTLTFTLDNSANAVSAQNVDFVDNLPANLLVADTPNIVNTCSGGTLTAVAGSANINYTGGAIPAAASCTIAVDVVSLVPGDYDNVSGDLTSAFGNSGNASDTLIVTAQAPAFSKLFAPGSTNVGVPVTLTFTLDNSSNAAPAQAVEFIDNLPTDLVVADTPNAVNTCSGGTITADAGSTSISYADGAIPAASVCTIAVDVVSQLPGDFVNVSEDMTSNLGNSGSASDTLTVISDAPIFELAFSPTSILGGEPATLTFNIDNSASAAPAIDLSFMLDLPTGLRVFAPIASSDSCTGGVLNAGAGSIDYSGGTVPAGASCSVSIDVTANGGIYSVTTTLNSSLGDSPGVLTSGPLNVAAVSIPILSTWGLLLLIALMTLVVFIYQRRSNSA